MRDAPATLRCSHEVHGEPVGAQAPVNAITDSLADLGERSEGTFPGDVSVVPTFPPPSWLVPVDIPRIRAGEGMWSASSPTALSLPGTSCENIPLGAEPGPSGSRAPTS